MAGLEHCGLCFGGESLQVAGDDDAIDIIPRFSQNLHPKLPGQDDETKSCWANIVLCTLVNAQAVIIP